MWSASTWMRSCARRARAARAGSRAGGVLGVDDAARGVAALAAEVELPVVAVEADAQLVGEARMCSGPSRTQISTTSRWHRPSPARSVSSMWASSCRRGRGRRRRRPGRSWCSTRRRALGDDDHAAVLGGAQREVEPGDAGADHQVVRFEHARNLAPRTAAVRGGSSGVLRSAGSMRLRRTPTICYRRGSVGSPSRARVCAVAGAGWACRCRRRRARRCARATASDGTVEFTNPARRSAGPAATFWARERGDGVVEFTNMPPVGSRWKVWLSTGPGKAAALRGTHRHRAGAGHVAGALLALRPAHSGSAVVLRHPRGADPRRDQDRVRLRSQRRVERRRQGPDAAHARHGAPDGRDRPLRSAAEHHGRRALSASAGAALLQDAGAIERGRGRRAHAVCSYDEKIKVIAGYHAGPGRSRNTAACRPTRPRAPMSPRSCGATIATARRRPPTPRWRSDDGRLSEPPSGSSQPPPLGGDRRLTSPPDADVRRAPGQRRRPGGRASATTRPRPRCCARWRVAPERPARAEFAGAGPVQARAPRRGARHLSRDRDARAQRPRRAPQPGTARAQGRARRRGGRRARDGGAPGARRQAVLELPRLRLRALRRRGRGGGGVPARRSGRGRRRAGGRARAAGGRRRGGDVDVAAVAPAPDAPGPPPPPRGAGVRASVAPRAVDRRCRRA